MKQYQNLLKDIILNGEWKEPAREGMPRTKEVFCRTMRFDLSQGFPLLTTKKMYTKAIVAELLWFLHGDTNIKYLLDNDTHIWDADAYKHYCRLFPMNRKTKEQFIENAKLGLKLGDYTYGDCGQIYGFQWRKNGFDQIEHLINSLKETPNSRYHVVCGWNPKTFLVNTLDAALPACHMIFQCCINMGKLDMMILQRSCDTFLGVPFNIASYALLCHILAKEIGVQVGILTWVGNCCHIYENHRDQVWEILNRTPLDLCTLEFEKKSLQEYNVSDFKFINYKSHSPLKAPLSVGV